MTGGGRRRLSSVATHRVTLRTTGVVGRWHVSHGGVHAGRLEQDLVPVDARFDVEDGLDVSSVVGRVVLTKQPETVAIILHLCFRHRHFGKWLWLTTSHKFAILQWECQ